jgi:hypothetical protein
MPRTHGRILRDGRELTGDVPVKLRTELGILSGHVTIPADDAVGIGPHVLRLRDRREIPISVHGVFDHRAYFSADRREVRDLVSLSS